MRSIIFHSNSYEVVGRPNKSADRLQILIKKGTHTLDEILDDVQSIQLIKLYEDDSLSSVFTGYKHFYAFTVLTDPNAGVAPEDMTISIEIQNSDLQEQINVLSNTLEKLQQEQQNQSNSIKALNGTVTTMNSNQSASIEDLGAELSNIADMQSTQSQAIEDLGSTISEVSETQTTQGQAIEDLGEEISTLASSIESAN